VKLVLAHFLHESNSFSPVPTPWEAFGPRGPHLGADAVAAMTGTRTPVGAFLDAAAAWGAEVDLPIAGYASPSAPVDRDAFERACELIVEAVRRGCDAILLDLHGAMIVAGGLDDGDGELLRRVRAAAPGVPIGVALDLHANVTAQMVANCDLIAGYHTYPHIDMYETGERVARAMHRMLRGGARPTMALQQIPVLSQTLKMNTSEGAMLAFVDRARAAEAEPDVLCASAFGGFPMADIVDAGSSAVVVTDGDPARAASLAAEIGRAAWDQRDDLVWHSGDLVDEIARAKAAPTGPVLLIDHADNCASGGTQDVMTVLREALRQGLTSIAVGPIRDPEAVAAMVAAGVGNEIELPVGGKLDMPALGLRGEPLVLRGTVRAVTDGEFTITGPQLTGVRAAMGRTAVLETPEATLVVTERLQEPLDLGVFTSVGVDPTGFRYLLLKSRMYFRPIFLPLAAEVVYCSGQGVTSSDWFRFHYDRLRRPIFPLDDDASFEPVTSGAPPGAGQEA
jgi:microcystin degradation protein MlrC